MLIENDSPYGIYLNLEEPSDNAGGSAEGQGSETEEIVVPEETGEATEPSYFHSYENDDGTKTDFKDAAELNTYMRQSGMRHADYTRKTQSLAEERKAYEANKARTDAEYTTFLTSKQQNDKIEKYLQSLPPEVFQRLQQGIKGQPKKAARDPEVDKMMKEYEADKKERESEKQRTSEEAARNKAFEALGKTYDDFDKESIMTMVNQLQEVPEEDQMRAFMEIFYKAQKGNSTPAEIEKKMAENLERKSKTTTPMSKSTRTPDTGTKNYGSLAEGRKAAMEDLL